MLSRWMDRFSSVRPELVVVFCLFAALGILHQLEYHQTAILNFFFLPVVLAGYYFGRARAVATAVASVALVLWFALLAPGAFEPESTSAAAKWADLGIWGSLLVLTAAALGHLYNVKQSAFSELQHAYHGVLEILSKFIDTADRYTEAHSVRVAMYAAEVARRRGLASDEVEDIRVAALLHDVGKLDVGVDLIRKVGDLSEQEWRELRRHPANGAFMVGRVGGILRNAVPLILYHHEHYDGSGYYGLRGEEIPLGARIIAVADAFDAMTTDRPYRSAMSSDRALAILAEDAGTHFDPEVVEAFVTAYRDPDSELAAIRDGDAGRELSLVEELPPPRAARRAGGGRPSFFKQLG